MDFFSLLNEIQIKRLWKSSPPNSGVLPALPCVQLLHSRSHRALTSNPKQTCIHLWAHKRGQRQLVLTVFDFSSRGGRLAHLNVWSAPRGPAGTHKSTTDVTFTAGAVERVGARYRALFCTSSSRLFFEIHPTQRRSLFPGIMSLCVKAEFDFNLRTITHFCCWKEISTYNTAINKSFPIINWNINDVWAECCKNPNCTSWCLNISAFKKMGFIWIQFSWTLFIEHPRIRTWTPDDLKYQENLPFGRNKPWAEPGGR